MAEPKPDDVLDRFLPPVAEWFRATLGEPTPPQRLGWPVVASGGNVLISAPTGSGKTLAAFLAALDTLWRTPRREPGVRLLYVSPLKALNYDIARNLSMPLSGIEQSAERMAFNLRPIRVAVRTGDTSASERQRINRKPPDLLITTPESLHLLLTSRARETLRHVSHVIVDEIHALASNKRGVFLSLLLERLRERSEQDFVRIGLSATQRPLEEVARYLGGSERDAEGRYRPRPVTVIDAGSRKELDLEVGFPAAGDLGPAGGSVWPSIEARVLELVQTHRSTIVFANNRRVAERLTARLNEAAGGAIDLAHAHHASLSLDRRRATEEALKAGELPAVVATASLEMGIDMGAVDLVCQIESPGGIARGLQRVGRAGHLVGAASKGRLLAKTNDDLLESAALAGAMLRGEVEPVHVPRNCLDILAQQVVACVAVEPWDAGALFDMVRRAYPYRDLTPAAFEAVLKLVSGRYHTETFRDLRARIAWDRVHQQLRRLPGSARLALVGGGAIPDTGQFPLHLGEDGPKLGELDEEFVLERRVGETFVLGTASWRIESIDPHRVVVSPAEGRPAFIPFWRGEAAGRTAELGEAVGELTREIVGRLDDKSLVTSLRTDFRLDEPSARRLRDYVARQVTIAGAAPDDRTILVEAYRDETGEAGLAVLTPFGNRVHHGLKLVLQARLRERLGIEPASLHGDEGILFRLPGMDEPPTDVFRGLFADLVEPTLRAELAESALFGLRFRQNAGRALLLPRPDPGKRTPLWLQRLRARDLLQGVRKHPDFPVLVETFRECLEDDLELPRLKALVAGVAEGSIRIVERAGELPSPFTSGLIFQFSLKYLYEWDDPKRAEGARAAPVDGDFLDSLLDPESYRAWLDPAAIGRVEGRLRGAGRSPRTIDEMAETLRELGDMTDDELSGPMRGFVEALEREGRAVRIELPDTAYPPRWIDAEERPLYERAFGETGGRDEATETIVARYLRTHALVGLDELIARYGLDPAEATSLLERHAESGELVRIDDEAGPRWADRRNLDEVRRISIALKRRESIAVPPEAFADYVVRRQHVHPATRREGPAALTAVLEQLQAYAAPPDVWENEILPRRLLDYRSDRLDEVLAVGGWAWRPGGEPLKITIVPRDFAGGWGGVEYDLDAPSDIESAVLAALAGRGAMFTDDVARVCGISPSRVRDAIDGLMRRGLVTNDRLDPLRPAGRARREALAAAAEPRAGRNGRPRLGSFRRTASSVPEGRWSLATVAEVDPETSVSAWAAAMLDRYGVLARELAVAEPWAPPWRELQPLLAQAELRGEVRRGYFVEGLSGVQYALPEVAEELPRLAVAKDKDGTATLISTVDPANLYGSGAPLDIPLLEGGTVRLSRSPANRLVLVAGRPVLIIEANGKRLTGPASASSDELDAALALLPGLVGPGRRVLKIETYNGTPAATSAIAGRLAALGFVRDPPGMAFYAGWSVPEATVS